MSKIKVGLVGVGNCASAMVQGVQYYRDTERQDDCIGLRHLYLGGYHPRDIELVSAFDIASSKVGKDLSEAIFMPPNNAVKFADVPKLGVEVSKGPVLDGVSDFMKDLVKIDGSPQVNVARCLKESGSEMVVNLLPGGAQKASTWYAEEALKAECAFINATPILIASNDAWSKRFERTGLPVVGDDLMDQAGATVIHKILLKTLSERGIRVSETYQLDVGGGLESLETLGRARELKRTIKTKTVETVLPYKASITAGSTDYVDFLGNRRDSYFWLSGLYFGRAPIRLDIKLSTADAQNAGSVMLDVIRGVKIALDRKETGYILAISTYAFKHPMNMLPLEEADRLFEEFIRGK